LGKRENSFPMRLDLTLEMERPQAVIHRRNKKNYRNVPFSLSREKGREATKRRRRMQEGKCESSQFEG
jgi:hypothetical protein